MAVTLSVIVAVMRFLVFQREKGFPASTRWTLAAVLGVWLTYIVRAYLWGNGKARRDASTFHRKDV